MVLEENHIKNYRFGQLYANTSWITSVCDPEQAVNYKSVHRQINFYSAVGVPHYLNYLLANFLIPGRRTDTVRPLSVFICLVGGQL